MKEPLWMGAVDAVVAHDLEIAAHGGSGGLRDAGLLESALASAKNIYAFGDPLPSLNLLAAAYAFRISSSRPFIDGNKRTALVHRCGD
jgi:death-on-curing protein